MKKTLILVALVLSGCSVGPNYVRPAAAVGESLPAAWDNAKETGKPLLLAKWWSLFEDSTLTGLVEAAHVGSPTVAEAYARLAQARGLTGISQAGALPNVTLQAQPLSRSDTGMSSQLTRSMGVAVSWEADVFGANRRDREATFARAEGAEFAVRAAQVALSADVASAYFTRRGCEAQLRLNEADLAARERVLSLTEARVTAGIAAPADGIRAKASMAEARAQRLALQGSCERSLNQLVALTGLTSGELTRRLEQPTAPVLPRKEITQVPAELLSDRADLRNTEAQVKAASAAIGVAQADKYPRLNLSGVITRLSSGPVGATSALMTTWSFAGSLAAPLFDGGRRDAAVNVAQAKYDETVAAYRGQVRTAVREVEDAFSKLNAAQAQARHLQDAQAQYARHFELAELRYRAGAVSLLELEDARRSWLASQISTTTTLTDQFQAHVALYRALGGGWADESCDQ